MSRTLVELSTAGSGVYLRTVSRAGSSPARFYLPGEELERLETYRYAVVSDMDSFAALYYREDLGTLEIRVSWLTRGPEGTLSGRAETVLLDWDRFHTFVLDSACFRAERTAMLSLETDFLPVLDFSDPEARKLLREVCAVPKRRRALVRALREGFAWAGPGR